MEIDAVYGDNARMANTAKARRARTKAKESTKVITRAARSLKATVVTVESGAQAERLSIQIHCC